MPEPGGSWREALLIGRHPDSRLFSDLEGAVWNYPGSRKGVLTADFTINSGSDGIRISLTDRWINPCDEYVKEYAVFSLVIDGDGKCNGVALAEPDSRFTLQLEFDLDKNILNAATEKGQLQIARTRTLEAPFGKELNLSYLHLQSAAEKADPYGVFLHSTNMKKFE